jgi:hypothetical protein
MNQPRAGPGRRQVVRATGRVQGANVLMHSAEEFMEQRMLADAIARSVREQ